MVPPSRIVTRALLVALAGCSADPGQGPGASATGPTAASAAASASLAPALRDPAWDVARASLDPLDIAALARVERAPSLLADIDDADYGDVARAALAEARDAELALPGLAARVRKSGANAQRDAELLLAIVSREPSYGEPLDPEGLSTALGDIDAVARDKSRDPRVRAIAVSISRRLADRNVRLSEPIPSDLDGE
jgi:hypothetical protein